MRIYILIFIITILDLTFSIHTEAKEELERGLIKIRGTYFIGYLTQDPRIEQQL